MADQFVCNFRNKGKIAFIPICYHWNKRGLAAMAEELVSARKMQGAVVLILHSRASFRTTQVKNKNSTKMKNPQRWNKRPDNSSKSSFKWRKALYSCKKHTVSVSDSCTPVSLSNGCTTVSLPDECLPVSMSDGRFSCWLQGGCLFLPPSWAGFASPIPPRFSFIRKFRTIR